VRRDARYPGLDGSVESDYDEWEMVSIEHVDHSTFCVQPSEECKFYEDFIFTRFLMVAKDKIL
jgi:hypothetical protein